MFKKLLLTLQLLQVVLCAPIVDTNNLPLQNGAEMKVRRQATANIDWKVSEYSACSASCDGGLRIRSVRCLNDDGIISEDCDIGSKPNSYEFCNQIDCTTNNPDSTLLPDSAKYTFKYNNISGILEFENKGQDSYAVNLNVTESDTTVTSINEMVSPNGTQRRIVIYGANIEVGIGQESNGDISLLVDEKDILNLNSPVMKIGVRSSQSVEYKENDVSIVDDSTISVIDDINTLYYYDGLRFYMFNGNIMNVLEGSGNLYYTPGRGIAVYSINRDLNTQLDTVIASLTTNTDPNPEVPLLPSTTLSGGPDFTTEHDISITTQYPPVDKPIPTEEIVIPDVTDDTQDSSLDLSEEDDTSDEDESSVETNKSDDEDKSDDDKSSVDTSNEDESKESDESTGSNSHSRSHHHHHHRHHRHHHPHHCHAHTRHHPHHHHPHHRHSHPDRSGTKGPKTKSI